MFIKTPLRLVLVLIVYFSLFVSQGTAQTEESAKFYPTWRNLNYQQKQQFLSGYLYGVGDARKIIDIVIGYLRDNPGEALSGLERIKKVYNTRGLDPTELVDAIDDFYEDPEHHDASLSLALSSAKAGMKAEEER